jgi:hypothetical protein
MHSHLGAEGMQGPSGIAAVEGDEDDGSNGDGGGNDKAAQGMVMQIDGADDIGPNGVFKSIAWWTSHHSEDGGLALIREFQLVVEEVLINQCFPSFRRNSRFEVDLGRLLDLARRRFEEKNKGQRALCKP